MDSVLFRKSLLKLTGVACLDSAGFGDPQSALRLAFSTQNTIRLELALEAH